MRGMRVSEDPDARFDKLYTKGPGCWIWNATRPQLQIGSRWQGTRQKVKAPRYAWERWMGSIPAGADVCHECDNPRCVRPSHLWLGTHSENNRDHCFKGRCRHKHGHGKPHGRPPVKSAVGADP